MDVILDFCGRCGSLLEEGLGLEFDPKCLNCGNSVKSRDNRAQGVFSDTDAGRLHKAFSMGDL